jgi:hypothetical protein
MDANILEALAALIFLFHPEDGGSEFETSVPICYTRKCSILECHNLNITMTTALNLMQTYLWII